MLQNMLSKKKNVHKYSDEEQVHLMKIEMIFLISNQKIKKVKFYNINESEHLYNPRNAVNSNNAVKQNAQLTQII